MDSESIKNRLQACIMLSIPPPGGGGNKIKGFGDGEKNQKLERKKKRILKIQHFW